VGEREVTGVAIFDRDATIIDVVRDEETGSISVAFHPSQLRLLDGAVDGMRSLQNAGFSLAIATNQPAPAKGQFSAQAVRHTNDALVDLLARAGVVVSAVEVCMHHPEGGSGGDPALVSACECRKPKSGMLDAIVKRLGAERARSWMIGDSPGDLKAGRAAALHTALVFLPNRCELCPLRGGLAEGASANGVVPDVRGSTLAEIAKAILAYPETT
jgi:D-glycero-D-manno-heptose 1,7-bisphosphate phosphatase